MIHWRIPSVAPRRSAVHAGRGAAPQPSGVACALCAGSDVQQVVVLVVKYKVVPPSSKLVSKPCGYSYIWHNWDPSAKWTLVLS